jgi:hypothetical protein
MKAAPDALPRPGPFDRLQERGSDPASADQAEQHRDDRDDQQDVIRPPSVTEVSMPMSQRMTRMTAMV